MKPFSLLVKPASALCNINCSYCFYKRALSLYPEEQYTRKMELSTADAMISAYFSLGFQSMSICFQGGEPLLMGLDFYNSVIDLEKKYGKASQIIGNSFQTNGLLITPEWTRFFKKYNMLIGISLDGTSEVHDRDRIMYTGEGTFSKVMNSIATLRQDSVEFNILSMITRFNAHRIDETYRFFREQKFTHLQFIPCIEEDPSTGTPSEHTITAELFGSFYKRLFDLWFERGYPDISIRMFDDILMYLVDGIHSSCGFQNTCDTYFMIEHNGDVYPCDFFAFDQYKIGSIVTDSFEKLLQSPKRLDFCSLKKDIADSCKKCSYISLCKGDCTKYRIFKGMAPNTVSYLCPGFKEFLDYSMSRFLEIKEDILRRRAEFRRQNPPPRIPANYPRNNPCPCGSQKKFKHCCG